MRFSTVASLITAAGYVNAAPFSFPLPNGFPNPSAATLAQIQKQAGGTLPNTPLPTSLKPADITSLQVIVTNELFEVAYFTSLLQNVTNGVKGYTEFGGVSKAYIIESLKQIRAQEELHAIGANAILQSAGQKTILPCKYTFPVSDFKSAIALAQTFTDVVLGTLPVVQQTFALDGGQAASGLVPLLGSIIAQEGEQNGAYRLLQRKVPSAAPFLTASTGEFAFNVLAQNFIVPASCGNLELIKLPHFKTLTTTSKLAPKNSTITFESSATDINPSTQSVAYISGQNLPVVVPITSVQHKKNSCTFKVSFPFDSGFSKGLTIAALVNGKGPFANAAAVAAATVAGPGLLEVD